MDSKEEEDIKKATFSHEKLMKALEGIHKSLPDIDPSPYCDCMLEFVKIFNIIGSAMAIAFQDITSKVAIIRRNYKNTPKVTGGLITFIEYEAGLKVQRCNGDNNAKEAPSKEYSHYESTTRTVLRLMWFFDFVSTFLNNLDADRKASTSSCVKEAYDVALGIHHPFVVRTAAKVAMLASPNRKNLFKGMFGEQTPDEDIYKFLQQAKEFIDPIRKSLWAYYEEKKLTDLP